MKYLAFFLIVLWFLPLSTGAQVFLPNQVSLSASPASPKPGEVVTITASSATADLARAHLTWTVNGVPAGSQAGLTSITLTMGGAGTKKTVRLEVSAEFGRLYDAELTLYPSTVGLAWEAVSYVPPFYKGRALPGTDTDVRIAAIAASGSGNTVTSKNTLIYTWKRGNTVLGSLSGRGRDTITIKGPTLGGRVVVSVDVTSTGATPIGAASVIIDGVDTKAVVYENDPLLGVRFEKAVQNVFPLQTSEVSFTAYPYFFQTSGRVGSLSHKWSVNGQPVQSVSGDQSTVALRQSAGSSGYATVGVSLEHLQNLLQTAGASFQVTFGQ